ncbi:hypothetical protein AB1Y20_007124 [Prymnesium parvum]|uniref:Uncharacterized protein n=1 Tax=Prymnesium parvum TaxID=97485 RepID=A0AB34J0A1_PRYPA
MKHKRRKEDALEPGGARTKAHTCRRQRYEYKSIGLTDVEAPHATHTDDVVVGCLKVGAIASWVFAAAFLLIFALQQAQAAQRLDLGIVPYFGLPATKPAGPTVSSAVASPATPTGTTSINAVTAIFTACTTFAEFSAPTPTSPATAATSRPRAGNS